MQYYQRIRDLREDSDLTQEALCRQLGMHKTTYTNYEQGKHTVPLDFAVTIADFYKVSLDYIAGRTNFPLGAADPQLDPTETALLDAFRALDDFGKGRVFQLTTLLSKGNGGN